MLNGIDNVYVINLDRHKLRRKRIQHNLSFRNIDFKFIDAIDGKDYEIDTSILNPIFRDPSGIFTKGVICCALSHRKAWKEFLDSGKETALFLEDDVRPTKYLKSLNWEQFEKDLKQTEWGVCWVGKYWEDITVKEKINDTFYKNETFMDHAYAAHSYILNRKSAEWYYNATKKIQYAADIRLEVSPFPQITLNKSLFVQRHKELEKFKDLIDNEKEYEYLNEWLHFTVEDGEWNEDEKYFINPKLPIKFKANKNIEISGKQVKWVEFHLDI